MFYAGTATLNPKWRRKYGLCPFALLFLLTLATRSAGDEDELAQSEAFAGPSGGFHPIEWHLRSLDSHRQIAERWAPNLFAAMSLYSVDNEYNKNCLTHLMTVGAAVQQFKIWAIKNLLPIPTLNETCIRETSFPDRETVTTNTKITVYNGGRTKLLDAFGKPGSYIMRGNVKWAGSYSTCLEVEPEGDFKAHYCWVDIEVENLPKISDEMKGNEMPIRTAICLPDSCSSEELYRIFQNVPDILNLPFYSEHINITGVTCKEPRKSILDDKWALTSIIIFAIAFFVIFLGTAADYYLEFKGKPHSGSKEPSDAGPFWETLLFFSVPLNCSRIFNYTPNDNGLSITHSLRTLFVMWAIMANSYFFSLPITDNLLDFLEASEGNLMQFLLKFSLGLDGLFFLSAMGITFYFFSLNDEKGNQSRMYGEYLFRIARMWAPYIVMLLMVFCGIGNYLGDGPFWFILEDNTKTCQSEWWLSAAYISNFKKTEGQCMRHAWYMALDMQYFFLMPLVIVPLLRWAPMGFIIAGIIQGVSMVISGLLSYNKDLPLMIDLKKDRPGVGAYDDFMDYLYVKPYYHVGASMIGIMCGWTLHRIRGKAEIKSIWVVFGWFLCALCIFFAVYGNTYGQTDKMFTVFYHTFKEIAFGLGLFWIIIACVTGHGGIINKFLSIPFWYPLGRISYCAFLLHGGWILVAFLNTETPKHFSFSLLNCYAVANITICYVLGLLLSLAFEAPVMNLKRYLLEPTPRYKLLH